MHPIEFILSYPYLRTKRWLKKSEYLSREHHIEFQKKKLAELLKFSAKEIPFYNERVGHLVKDISSENAFEILKQFPFVSKAIIRQNMEWLCKKSLIRRVKATTGGTTASPMSFYFDRFITRQMEKAYIWNMWSRKGYRPYARIASFTGRVPKASKIFEHDKFFNIFIFSPYDLTKEKIRGVIFALNYLKPEFLHGYPSNMTTLAKLVQNSNLKINFNIKAVFCGSEKTFFHQREIIENVFNTSVFAWYGHSENCVLGGECEYSHFYHLFPQYGYVEFLEVGKNYQKTAKNTYEIVATGFNNWIMPFIRYKTADYAILGDSNCKCGRNYPIVKEVVGRTQEFVLDKKENLISVTALSALYEKSPFISDSQIFQDTPGKIILLIIRNYEAPKAEIDKLILRIESAAQNRLKVHIQFVNKIQKSRSLKRRIVDQRIELSSYLK